MRIDLGTTGVSFTDQAGELYAYDLWRDGGDAARVAQLWQRLRLVARTLGYKRIIFVVGAGMPSLMKLTRRGRATVLGPHERGILLSMEV